MAYVSKYEKIAKEEGKLEGKVQGKIEGREEGKLEGPQEFLLDLLTARFGVLPAWVVEKVRPATKDELLIWALVMLDHEPLEEIFSS